MVFGKIINMKKYNFHIHKSNDRQYVDCSDFLCIFRDKIFLILKIDFNFLSWLLPCVLRSSDHQNSQIKWSRIFKWKPIYFVRVKESENLHGNRWKLWIFYLLLQNRIQKKYSQSYKRRAYLHILQKWPPLWRFWATHHWSV